MAQETSIPIDYNITTPAGWAIAELEYLGAPTTTSNINFLVSWAAQEGGNWNNTAHYNPLNTTLQYAGSSTMSGGNTAGVQAYASWQDGIAATAQTLQGYPQIVAALQSGNAMQDQGNFGSELSEWSGGGYSSVGSNTGYANVTGGATGPQEAGVGQGTPNVPGMNDIPGLVAYIEQNDPQYAWLLNIPDVGSVIEKAVAAGYGGNADYITAQLEQTAWWKNTSQAVRNYMQSLASDPADFSFRVPGSTAQQTQQNVQAEAAGLGVNLSAQQAQILAMNYMKFGWDSQQLQEAIGAQVTYAGPGKTDAATVAQQLTAMAGQYLQPLSAPVIQSWAQNIAGGTQTMAQFQAYMQENASTKWSGLAPQIAKGMTPQQIVDPLIQNAASTLEVSPDQIDMVNNPQYQKILDYVPPGEQEPRLMTQSEESQYLKGLPQYGYTQQARDTVGSYATTILQDFGRVGT